MELMGLIITAVLLALLGLAVWFGYLLVTSRTSMGRAHDRWERSEESDRD